MRKLMGVLAVLLVLGICYPSYGYILTYRGTIPVKGVDVNDNNDLVTVPLKAFLVLDVNEANQSAIVADANLILAGKRPDKSLKYAVLSTSDANVFLTVNITEDGDVFVVELISNNCHYNFDWLMLGAEKKSKFNLGPEADNNDVARSLKGAMLNFDLTLLSPEQKLTATGTVSMSLDPKRTAGSAPLNLTTIGAVTDNITATFLKKYTKLSPGPCID